MQQTRAATVLGVALLAALIGCGKAKEKDVDKQPTQQGSSEGIGGFKGQPELREPLEEAALWWLTKGQADDSLTIKITEGHLPSRDALKAASTGWLHLSTIDGEAVRFIATNTDGKEVGVVEGRLRRPGGEGTPLELTITGFVPAP